MSDEAVSVLKTTKNRRLGVFRQWAATITIAWSYLILGTSLGWPSPVLYEIRQSGTPLNLTDSESAIMVSLLYVGNLVMPLPSSFLIDYKGRKIGLLIMTVAPLSSWLLIYFARHGAMLHAARILAGMWSGVVLTAVPLYIGEIAEPEMRGALSTLGQIFTNVGILIVYISGPLISYWSLAILCGIITAVIVPILVVIPESPYWLLYKGYNEKAAKSLLWLRGTKNPDDITNEMGALAAACDFNRDNPTELKTLWKSRGNRKALIVVLFLAAFQRFSGISAIIAYASTSLPLESIGFLTPNHCVIIIGGLSTLSVIIMANFVDRFGRVPLLLISCAGCFLSHTIAGVWYYLYFRTDSAPANWIPFVAFLGYGFFFNFGLGPVASTIQGEMFPPNFKATASGCTAIVLSVASIIVNGCFSHVANNWGMYVNFFIFSMVSFACFLFVKFYVVETRNKTLNEIQEDLHARSLLALAK